jgi:hypothetical protein
MGAVRLFAGLALATLVALPASAEMRLLMAEQPGCVYCERWDREIADIYPLTDEGRTAPLLRVQIRDPLPEGITIARALTFTPTFVLLMDGIEVRRIEGYPGEDFFWGLLGMFIDEIALAEDQAAG